MKHPANCACKCSKTTCTKWTLYKAYSSYDQPVNYQNKTSGTTYSETTFGPNDRILHDAEFCRQTLNFAYDEDTFEQSVSIFTPPHIDCGSTDPEAAQRRVIPALEGWNSAGNPIGLNAVSMHKVIKLKKGQRIRVRLVTDTVACPYNYISEDLHWLFSNTYDPDGTYTRPAGQYIGYFPYGAGQKYGPVVTVTPAKPAVWDAKKPCSILRYPINQEKWYAAGVWPYDDTDPWTNYAGAAIPDGNTYNDINRSEPTRTYGYIEEFYSPITCYMPTATAGIPPEIHPSAPNADKHPAVYTAHPRFGLGGPSVSTNFGLWVPDWVKVDGIWEKPEPGQQTDATANFMDSNLQNWFSCQYMPFPAGNIWEDIDTLYGDAQSSAAYRRSLFSAPETIMVQPDETNPSGVPVTEAPFKTYMLLCPSISRGFTQETGGPKTQLRPDYPTDTGYVEAQRVAWENLFENVTFHELELPEHMIRSTARPRTVIPDWLGRKLYAVSYIPEFPDDHAGMTGKQNGCFNPGICDIEMVIDIDKTGPWVLHIGDTSSVLTHDGATTVVTFTIEEPDPDNEGEWIAFDARNACKPDATPDHTGWMELNYYDPTSATYLGPFFVWGIGSYGLRNVRVDQSVPCTEPAGNNVTGKYVSYLIQDGTLYDAAYDFGKVLIDGDHFTEFRTQSQYYEDAWSIIPNYVLNQYYNHTRDAYCCGYAETKYPLISSSCHHHHNWNEIQALITYSNGLVAYKHRTLYTQSATPDNFKWILPW